MKINLEDGSYINITIWKNDKGVYEYYNDGILLGIFNPNVMKDTKFFEVDIEKMNNLEGRISDEGKEIIEKIVNEVSKKVDELKLEEIEEEASDNLAITEYMEEMGIPKEKIESVKKLDLEREKEEKKDDKEKQPESEIEEEKSKETYVRTNDVNIKQEVDLDEMATDVESIGKWLGGKIPKDITKIAVIPSEEMSKMKDENGEVIDKPTTRYALVVISKDENGKGKRVEPLKKYIPELEQNDRAGRGTTKSQYQLSTNGEVEKDGVLSEYKIGDKIIQLDKDSGDDFEINIGKYAPTTNELVTTRLRDSNTTFKTDKKTREAVLGHFKGRYATQNSYEEAKEKEEAGYNVENFTYEDIDGEIEPHLSEKEIDQYVQEMMKNEQISNIFTEREVRERLEKNINKKLGKEESIKEIKKETEQGLEQDATMYETLQKRNTR